MIVPKIVWPSAGANELLFAFPPVGVRPFDRAARRHDTIASSGKRQSLLERTDKFLELDITLVPTEVENYLLRSEQFDNAAWTKAEGTITADADDGPLPGTKGDRFVPTTPTTNASIIQFDITTLPEFDDRTVGFPIWLKAPSGAPQLKLLLQDQVWGIIATTAWFSPTSGWQRYFVSGIIPVGTTEVRCVVDFKDPMTLDVDLFGGQLHYGSSPGPYVETEGAIPAAIDRWDTFITAVLDGTNFDYYPDAFAAGFTTYVLEDKVWRPKLQVRGANRFYEFKLRLREFV